MAVKWDINLGTIVSVGGMLIGGLLWVNTQIVSLESRTLQADKSVVELTGAVRGLESAMLRQTGDVNNLTYRMTQSETGLRTMGERMDRVVDSVLLSVDSIKKEVAGLSTKFEVLNQKIDSLDVPRMTKRPNETR